ncbi:polysaccharide biosynthesis/export family protein [Polaribacter sp. Z014]|uniref:polysaccharide biosynthesis/export family protein n=1 Tax=unclassified Polaribacter TaxID=196858 RepID=UPI00193C0454|nr:MULTISPECIES: polysaccharide biosynthesis/export family protein [unclassified Polaribacter]MCL7763438.1 polysaccharide biosynthesis/export family protein [Polaribacter sp. Z014]QVY66782.1 polysaccharide biosynthesis/export family protein [Polaribacter sp. Q13]
MRKHFLLLLFIPFLFSCIPAKDIIYLQGEPVARKEIKRINNIPYKLQVDDILNIDIKSNDESLVSVFKKQSTGSGGGSANTSASAGASFFSGYSIDSYGNIRMPTLGEINVLGYTELEVRKKLENELKKFIRTEEEIFVSVKLAGIKYTAIGEIGSPGPNVIFQNKLSIIDAISSSGDITTLGNKRKVEIIRNSITGTEKFTIDLTQINAFDSEVFYIKPNDIINVIPLKQKTWGTGTTGLGALATIVSILSLVSTTYLLARNL